MAAGAWNLYSNGVLNITNKAMNLGSDAYQIILATNSYTPAPNTDSTYANVSGSELTTALGYTAGGIALTSVSNTLTTATVTFTSAAASWTTFSATLRYAVIIHKAGGSLVSGDLLLCYSDLTGSGSITGGGGTFTITMNASGIFAVTHSP